ncbi:MAG: long-chain fatty acid--CoA ligase [Methylorubrum populi]
MAATFGVRRPSKVAAGATTIRGWEDDVNALTALAMDGPRTAEPAMFDPDRVPAPAAAETGGFQLRFTQGLHRALQTGPDAVATLCNGRAQTFRTLADRVTRIAGALRALGVRRGDRVAILALNSDRVLEYYLAVPWIGALVVPLNFRWSTDEIIDGLTDSGARVLFVDDAFAALERPLTQACPGLRRVVFCGEGEVASGTVSLEALVRDNDPVPDAGIGGAEPFGIFYTGGTTGRAKGVVLSHANVLISAMGILGEGAYAEGAVGLHAAPMFHLADLMATACLLLRGGTHVMLPAFQPEAVAALIERHRITDLLMVPTMLQMLVDHPAFTAADTTSLHSLLYGASPASEALIDRAMRAMPDVAFGQVYGMTEAAATISILRPCDHDPARRSGGRLRSAGRGFCHTQVRTLSPDGSELGPGEVGEIAVRGPNVMVGYRDRPDDTAEALRDGWLHTGDMGYLDEAGYVFIVDRAKDMIITGGENVYSLEVENAVCGHPAVAAAAVIGIPNPDWGESIHAVVVLRPGQSLTLDELAGHCRQRITPYKCPRSLDIVERLPVSAAGKLLKTVLRRPFWEGRERAVS